MSELENQSNIGALNKTIQKFEDENSSKFKNYSILSIIKENNKKSSKKTVFSSSYIKLKDYEINKFDELNKSLSNISNFDLEKEDDGDSSFNSSKINEIEFIEIIIPEKMRNKKEENIEYEIELDKEFEEIKKEVFNEK